MLLLSRFGKQSMKTVLRCKYTKSSKACTPVSNLIDIHPEVLEALGTKKPVVALESTIITHGMPQPYNLETAIEVEDIVRKEGSTPATIAILNGRIRIGLTRDELRHLAGLESESVFKCSRRDFGFILSKKFCGGTTVAGTLIVANMVGIKVFATGGIGGVHRDGHISLDVSADLIELGRTPVCVVSSGVKSILDIPRTLEYLETQGVCVASYQKDTRDFPAFYTRSSGVKAPYNLNSPQEAALMLKASLDLNLESGILIGVPIPEEYAIDEDLIKNAIDSAVGAAEAKGIIGKEVTPFVLDAVSKITAGRSLNSNMALIKNNARVASQIAVEFSNVSNASGNVYQNASDSDLFTSDRKLEKLNTNNVPVVIGASILDICMTALEDDLKLDGATYKVKSMLSAGGVGRNIAEGLFKIHGKVHLISAIGDDDSGNSLNSCLPTSATAGVIKDGENATSICTVICDRLGDCKLVLGNMKIHDAITSKLVLQNEAAISQAPLVVMDANLSIETMKTVLEVTKKYNKPVFFEPTDMRIADKPFNLPKKLTNQIKIISPNIFELQKIAEALNANNYEPINSIDNVNVDETLKMAKELAKSVIEHFDCIIVTLGPMGVLLVSKGISDRLFDDNHKYCFEHGSIKYRYYSAPKLNNLINVSGAGDSFTSGFISAMLSGASEKTCTAVGFKAARCALMAESAVPEIYFSDNNDKQKWFEDQVIPKEV